MTIIIIILDPLEFFRERIHLMLFTVTLILKVSRKPRLKVLRSWNVFIFTKIPF